MHLRGTPLLLILGEDGVSDVIIVVRLRAKLKNYDEYKRHLTVNLKTIILHTPESRI